MHFKHDVALQNIPLSKYPFKRQPWIENEDVTWSPQYNPPTTRTSKRKALSLQEVKLDAWFLILHIVLKTCSIWFMHKFNMSFIFHFYILRWMSWILTNPSIEGLKFKSPLKLLRGLQSWTLMILTLESQCHGRFCPFPSFQCKIIFPI